MLLEQIELEPGEKMLKMVRKHWFIIAAELFGTFVMIILPFLIFFIFVIFSDSINALGFAPSEHVGLIAFATGGWLLLSLLSGFRIWTHYYLDLWAITDRRIISVDQIGFFNRNVSMFRLERMQDIAYDQKGLLSTLLNYGTIRAHTAGNNEDNFHAPGLPDPRGLQATIQSAMDERMRILHITPDSV